MSPLRGGLSGTAVARSGGTSCLTTPDYRIAVLMSGLIYCALEPDRMPDTAVYHLPIPSLCTLPCQVAWLFVLLPQVKCQLVAVATSGGIGNGIPTVDSLSVCTGDSCTGVQLWKIIVVKDL
jgi:hypothetical protein